LAYFLLAFSGVKNEVDDPFMRGVIDAIVSHAQAVSKSRSVQTLLVIPASIAGVQRMLECIRQKL
jgi:hypothetical protein